MPVTAAALSQAHRTAQLRLGAIAIRQLRAVWRLLIPEDLDGTFEDWLVAVIPLVETQRHASATIAANYLSALRALELGVDGGRFAPVLADQIDRRAVTTSMLVTGPISIRGNLGRMTLQRAVDIAEGRSAAAAMRHALNGGRETIVQSAVADKRAVGWVRVASPNACDYCSSLADGGAVSSADSANFAAHDGCTCTAEPVYR